MKRAKQECKVFISDKYGDQEIDEDAKFCCADCVIKRGEIVELSNSFTKRIMGEIYMRCKKCGSNLAFTQDMVYKHINEEQSKLQKLMGKAFQLFNPIPFG